MSGIIATKHKPWQLLPTFLLWTAGNKGVDPCVAESWESFHPCSRVLISCQRNGISNIRPPKSCPPKELPNFKGPLVNHSHSHVFWWNMKVSRKYATTKNWMVWRKKNSLANRNGMGKLTRIPSWLHAARLASVSVSPSSTKSWAAWRFENGTPFWVLFPWPWVLSPFLQLISEHEATLCGILFAGFGLYNLVMVLWFVQAGRAPLHSRLSKKFLNSNIGRGDSEGGYSKLMKFDDNDTNSDGWTSECAESSEWAIYLIVMLCGLTWRLI